MVSSLSSANLFKQLLEPKKAVTAVVSTTVGYHLFKHALKSASRSLASCAGIQTSFVNMPTLFTLSAVERSCSQSLLITTCTACALVAGGMLVATVFSEKSSAVKASVPEPLTSNSSATESIPPGPSVSNASVSEQVSVSSFTPKPPLEGSPRELSKELSRKLSRKLSRGESTELSSASSIIAPTNVSPPVSSGELLSTPSKVLSRVSSEGSSSRLSKGSSRALSRVSSLVGTTVKKILPIKGEAAEDAGSVREISSPVLSSHEILEDDKLNNAPNPPSDENVAK